jgi:hypothetical protein
MKHLAGGFAWIIVHVLPCFGLSSGALAQGGSPDTDTATLFQRSWDSPSPSEKAVLRKKIADASPNSRYGMLSTAWLLERDQRQDAAITAYQACLKVAPDFLPCKLNLAADIDAKQSVALLQEICEKDPALVDYDCFKRQVSLIAGTGDKAAFRALLASAKKSATPAVLAYLSAYWANAAEKDTDKAITVLGQSSARHELDYSAILLWMNLKAPDGRINPSKPEDIRAIEAPMLAFAKELIEHNAPPARIATVLEGFADKMHSAYRDDGDALYLYQQAFQYYPSHELVDKIWNTGKLPSSRWLDAVSAAHKLLPDNFAVTRDFAEARIPEDVEDAEHFYLQAIDQAPTSTDKVNVELAYADFLARYRLDSRHATAIFNQVLSTAADKGDIYYTLFRMLLTAGDLEGASDVLTREQNYLQDRNQANLAVLDNLGRQLRELKSFDELRQARTAAPFLSEWDDTFKGDTVEIAFSANSSELPQAAQDELRLVANHLNRVDATGFYVGLVGVAGPSEQAQLATQRSEHVASYLNKTLGVDLSKLQLLQPATSETTLAPQAAPTAVVRISVLGDLHHPKISVTRGAIAAGQVALSPDGRFLATGSGPVQIWDTAREIKLRDLAEGLSPTFSPDGKYIALISEDLTAVRVYEVITGRPVAQVAELDEIQNISWNPDSNAIAYVAGRQLTVFSIEARKRTAVRDLADRIFANKVVWLRDGLIATAQPWAKEIKLWEERTLQPRRTLGEVYYVHALAASPDARILAAYDNSNHLTLFSTSDWSFRQIDVPVTASQIVFSGDTSRIVLNNWDIKKKNGFAVVDTQDLRVSFHPLDDTILKPGFAISPDGRTLYMAADLELSKWQFPSIERIAAIGAASPTGRGVRALPDRRQLLVYDGEGINLWNTEAASLLHHWPIKATRILGSNTGTEVLAVVPTVADGTTDVIALTLDSGAERRVLHLPYLVGKTASCGTLYGFAGTPFYPGSTHEPQLFGTVELYDSHEFAQVAHFTTPLVRQNLYWGGAGDGGFSGFDIAADCKTLALSSWWEDGYGFPGTFSQDVQLLDIPGGQPGATKPLSCGIKGLWFEGDTLNAQCDYGLWQLAPGSGKPVRKYNTNAGDTFTDGSARNDLRFGRRYLVAQDTAGQVLYRKDYPGNLVSVSVSPQQGLAFALTADDEIEYLRLGDFTPLIKSFARADGEWVSFAMDGRYAASASMQAVSDVQWVVGDKSVALSHLGRDYEDPDFIRGILNASKTAPVAGPDSDSINRISNRFTESDKIIEVDAAASMRQLPIGAATLNNEKITILGSKQGQIQYHGDAVLKQGLNQIAAAGQQIMLWKEKATVSLFTRPYPNSHAVIIAIDDYERTRRPDLHPTGYPQLKQMVNQARRLTDTLVSVGFPRANIHTLYDEQATSTAISSLLKEFWAGGRYATADRLFIYFGGHGVAVGQNGILVTYDYDPQRPTTFSIPLSSIRADEMSLITARQVMVALDACASGLAGRLGDDDPTSTERKRLGLKEIETGANAPARNLLVATTGAESALWVEDGGIFTTALIDALSGKADDGYGVIDFEDVAHYVKTHVKWRALGQGLEQEPQSYNYDPDQKSQMLFVTSPGEKF